MIPVFDQEPLRDPSRGRWTLRSQQCVSDGKVCIIQLHNCNTGSLRRSISFLLIIGGLVECDCRGAEESNRWPTADNTFREHF
jgi:hypothetical protein